MPDSTLGRSDSWTDAQRVTLRSIQTIGKGVTIGEPTPLHSGRYASLIVEVSLGPDGETREAFQAFNDAGDDSSVGHKRTKDPFYQSLFSGRSARLSF